MTMRTIQACGMILLSALVGSSGCAVDPAQGYTLAAAHSQNIRTVALPIFDNTTFHYGMEMRLTEAISKELIRTTPWVVASEASADTTLRGVISDVALRPLSRSRESGLSQEFAMDIAVDFEWRDNRTGRTILSRRNYRASSTFAPARGIGEPIEVGEQGAVEALARDIVRELRADW